MPSQRPQDVWKSSSPAGSTPAKRDKATSGGAGRWFLAARFVVAFVGAIGGLLVYLWPTPTPTVLAIPVTEYDHEDWPPNPWAVDDARGLLERVGKDATEAFQAQEKDMIRRELTGVAEKTPSRQPIVVYLSTLGLAANGTIYLIPARGRPDDPTSWLTLDDVLSPLRSARAPCLLILDVRPASDLRSVVVGEDVNQALDLALNRMVEENRLPFFVLTANTPPTGANVIRPLRRTAFGLALAQGAGGAADGWNLPERKQDGRVSVHELGFYVSELTRYASEAAGLPAQFPRLHGKRDDFDVFVIPQGEKPSLPALVEPDRYPDWLQTGWKTRDHWVQSKLHLRAPRLIHQLTLTNSRAERRWLAGIPADELRGRFDKTIDPLRKTAPTLPPVELPTKWSLARASQKSGLKVDAMTEMLQGVFNRIRSEPGKDRDAALEQAMQAVWDKVPEAEFDSVAIAIFNFALARLGEPRQEQIKQLAILAGGFKQRPPRRPELSASGLPAELLTLSLIAGLDPRDVDPRWPPGTIVTLLQVAKAAEEATAYDGRFLPWIASDLQKTDLKRRQALRLLCEADSNKNRETSIKNLEDARRDYDQIRQRLVALASTRSEYEATRAVLVDLAVAYPREASQNQEVAAKTWEALVDDVLNVEGLLRPQEKQQLPDVGKLTAATESMKGRREDLLVMLSKASPGTSRQCELLLRWPHWPTDRAGTRNRLSLLEKLREVEREAARKVRDGWLKGPPEQPTQQPGRPPVVGWAVGDLRRWYGLLRLVHSDDLVDLSPQVERLGPDSPGQAVSELAVRVRKSLRTRLADSYGFADLTRQSWIGWAVDPDDVPAHNETSGQPPSPAKANPELLEERKAAKDFHEWLATYRYAADAAEFGASKATAAQKVSEALQEIAKGYRNAFP